MKFVVVRVALQMVDSVLPVSGEDVLILTGKPLVNLCFRCVNLVALQRIRAIKDCLDIRSPKAQCKDQLAQSPWQRAISSDVLAEITCK